MKKFNWRRLLAGSLSAFMLLGTLPTNVLAAEGHPNSPEVTRTVTYNDDMSEAKITYQVKPLEQQKVNVFFLAAADADNQNTVQYALNDGINSYYYAGRMLMEWGEPNPTRIITYGEDVQDSGVLTDYNSLKQASSIPQMSGTADEVNALQAMTAAVNEADSSYPSVVFWLMGSKSGIQSDEEAVKAELDKLKDALGSDGALIVYEYTDAPTAYLDDYVATYTKGDSSSAKAHRAFGAIDNGLNRYPFELGHNIRTVVMDNYDEYDEDGDFDRIGYNTSVDFDIALSDDQTVVTDITGVEVRDERHYSYFSESDRPETDENNVSSGIGVKASLDKETNTIHFNEEYLFSMDTLRITITVALDPNVTDTQTVIDAQDVTFKLRTGLFDDTEESVTVSFPETVINKGERTVSYDLNGGTGTAPESQSAAPNTKVIVAEGTGFSKEGESFGGWQVVSGPESLVGKTLKPGSSLTMGTENVVLKALWAHPVVTLEVGQATPAPEGEGQVIANDAGRLKFGSGDQAGLLNFWGLTDSKGARIQYIDQIDFADEELSFTSAPDSIDTLKVTVDGREDILYARQIGAEGYSVIAYLTAGGEAGHYNMTITGENGVVAPASARDLFSHGQYTGDGFANVKENGWNSTLAKVNFNGNFDTSTLQDADGMFYCAGLTELPDFANQDLSALVNAKSMFNGCKNLGAVDLSTWNTPVLTNIAFMFQNCSSMPSAKLSGWDVSKVTAANSMFRGCSNLTSVDMEGWSLPEVVDLEAFFYQCSSLPAVDISDWSPTKVTKMDYIFADCTVLQDIVVGDWNLPSLNNFYNAFQNCKSLTEMDLSGWTTPSLGDVMSVFSNCSNLEKMSLPSKANFEDMAFAYAFWALGNLKEFRMPAWNLDGMNNYSLSSTMGNGSLWGNYSDPYPKDVKFIIDDWNVTTENFLTSAPENFAYPWTAISTSEFSAKNWNLNDLPQDLSELHELTYSMVEFSGWTGLGGVTDISGMFSSQSRITTVSFAGADFSSLQKASRMFGSSNKSLTTLDFSGITGITDQSVLTDMFVGIPKEVQSTVTLTVTDDEIGGWISDEFTKAGCVADNITKLPAGVSTAVENNDTPYEEDMTSIPAEAAADFDEPAAVPAADRVPADDTESENDTAPLEAVAFQAPVAGQHPQASNKGDEYYIKTTVRFEGDTGALSENIDLSVALPENMSFAADPEIVTGDFVTIADPEVSSKTGRIVNEASIGGNELTAVFNTMEAGSQIQISFRGVLSDEGIIDGNQKVWDVEALAADQTTSSDCTYRFWQSYSDGSGGGSGGGSSRKYTLRYDTNGGEKIDSEYYRRTWTKKYEDLPVPVREGYTFKGWYKNDDLTERVTDDIYVNSSVVVLYAKWSKDAELLPEDTGVSSLLNTKDHNVYLNGYETGFFGPNNHMTRAEVAQMFYSLLLKKDVPTTVSFVDVPANAWYAKAVNTLASLGIVTGVGNNEFDPNRPITRAEFTAIAMRFTNGAVTGENIFSDVTKDDWFYGQVVGSIQYGWIAGYEDGTFRPNNNITRAEVTTITNRMLGRSADKDFVDQYKDELRMFPDLTTGHWAYYQIMEATNAHDYTLTNGIENWTGLK